MRGSISLPLWRGNHFLVAGGPYKKKPEKYLGVKMAMEIDAPCEVDLPVADFNVPRLEDFNYAVRDTLRLVLSGNPVYVGCMGGIGRTGLMLAGLAKAFGIERPVEYVREHYYPHAVETDQQRKLIESWEVPSEIRLMVFWAKVRTVFSRKKLLTN